MTDSDSQRVAIVTGGAVRVGRAISLELARAGYDLLVLYGSSGAEAESLAKEVSALGRRAELLQVDLTDGAASARVREALDGHFERLDLLVNSAANFHAETLDEVDIASWNASMELNARTPHLLVRALADHLRATRGAIVNIVDLSALRPWPSYAAHSVSKAALAQLTRLQALHLAPEVRVNAIAPGAVLAPDDWSEEKRASIAARVPMKRWGTAEDVAAAVRFLAEAPFLTGQLLAVDGGRSLG